MNDVFWEVFLKEYHDVVFRFLGLRLPPSGTIERNIAQDEEEEKWIPMKRGSEEEHRAFLTLLAATHARRWRFGWIDIYLEPIPAAEVQGSIQYPAGREAYEVEARVNLPRRVWLYDLTNAGIIVAEFSHLRLYVEGAFRRGWRAWRAGVNLHQEAAAFAWRAKIGGEYVRLVYPKAARTGG